MRERWVERLAAALGDDAVLTDRATLAAYGFDASYRRGLAEAVVFPRAAADVAAVLRVAGEHGVPVYPRGGGTGLAGGSVPQGGIALALKRMNRILDVDTRNLQVRVEPGATLADLREALAPHGLFYPVDPGSYATSTIGGNVATNAGGPRAFRFGTTRRYVLGMEVVLAGGRLLRLGGRTTKRVCGYDLAGLIVGSEGTLAVVTEATLALLPAPAAGGTIVAWFPEAELAAAAVGAVAASPARPASIEFMDAASLRAVAEYLPETAIEGEALLLCELLGHPGALAAEADELQALCRAAGAGSVRAAMDAGAQARLWAVRRAIAPAVARIKPTKISEDATVPLAEAPRFVARLREIGARFGVRLVVFGHAGDGNFHPNILCDERDPEEMRRVDGAVEAIFAAALELGGTLSGEHGIGLLKAPWLERAAGSEAVALMRQLKSVFDPRGILNPGKLFPSGRAGAGGGEP